MNAHKNKETKSGQRTVLYTVVYYHRHSAYPTLHIKKTYNIVLTNGTTRTSIACIININKLKRNSAWYRFVLLTVTEELIVSHPALPSPPRSSRRVGAWLSLFRRPVARTHNPVRLPRLRHAKKTSRAENRGRQDKQQWSVHIILIICGEIGFQIFLRAFIYLEMLGTALIR